MSSSKFNSLSQKQSINMNNFFSNFNVLYLLVLVARNYISNTALWITNFLVPILVFFIIHGILEKAAIGLSIGVASSGVVSIGVLSLGVSLTEWKNSVIYKKIKVSLFSSFQFFLIFVVFYFFISFLSFWITIAASWLISHDVFENFQKITEWAKFFLSLFLLIFTSILIGVFVSIATKNTVSAQGLGFGIYILSSFLTSSFIPMTTSMKTDFLWIGGWWTPTFAPIQNLSAIFFENLTLADAYENTTISSVNNSSETSNLFNFNNMKLQVFKTNGTPSFQGAQIGFIQSFWINVGFSLAWIATLSTSCYILLKIKK